MRLGTRIELADKSYFPVRSCASTYLPVSRITILQECAGVGLVFTSRRGHHSYFQLNNREQLLLAPDHNQICNHALAHLSL